LRGNTAGTTTSTAQRVSKATVLFYILIQHCESGTNPRSYSKKRSASEFLFTLDCQCGHRAHTYSTITKASTLRWPHDRFAAGSRRSIVSGRIEKAKPSDVARHGPAIVQVLSRSSIGTEALRSISVSRMDTTPRRRSREENETHQSSFRLSCSPPASDSLDQSNSSPYHSGSNPNSRGGLPSTASSCHQKEPFNFLSPTSGSSDSRHSYQHFTQTEKSETAGYEQPSTFGNRKPSYSEFLPEVQSYPSGSNLQSNVVSPHSYFSPPLPSRTAGDTVPRIDPRETFPDSNASHSNSTFRSTHLPPSLETRHTSPPPRHRSRFRTSTPIFPILRSFASWFSQESEGLRGRITP